MKSKADLIYQLDVNFTEIIKSFLPLSLFLRFRLTA